MRFEAFLILGIVTLLESCVIFHKDDISFGHERFTRDITNCGPNDTEVPPNRVNTSLQLSMVRGAMAGINVTQLIVPLDTVGRLKWVSGFSGSNGEAVITQDQGRVFLIII